MARGHRWTWVRGRRVGEQPRGISPRVGCSCALACPLHEQDEKAPVVRRTGREWTRRRPHAQAREVVVTRVLLLTSPPHPRSAKEKRPAQGVPTTARGARGTPTCAGARMLTRGSTGTPGPCAGSSSRRDDPPLPLLAPSKGSTSSSWDSRGAGVVAQQTDWRPASSGETHGRGDPGQLTFRGQGRTRAGTCPARPRRSGGWRPRSVRARLERFRARGSAPRRGGAAAQEADEARSSARDACVRPRPRSLCRFRRGLATSWAADNVILRDAQFRRPYPTRPLPPTTARW